MNVAAQVVVVVPVHNRRELTRTCLESLARQDCAHLRVVVVDDGSTDGTAEMVRERFPGVKVLRGSGDLWWSGAVNVGCEYALTHGAAYVLLANDDTVFDEGMVGEFVRAAEGSPRLVQGAVARDWQTGSHVYGAIGIDWWWARFVSLAPPVDEESPLQDSEVLCGRGLFIPAAVLRDVGPMSASLLPQTFADYEWTQRAKSAGYPLVVNHAAVVLVSETSIGSQVRGRRSWRGLWRHLFGMKGAGNLVFLLRYARMVAPPVVVVQFSVCGVLRRVVGYFK